MTNLHNMFMHDYIPALPFLSSRFYLLGTSINSINSLLLSIIFTYFQ